MKRFSWSTLALTVVLATSGAVRADVGDAKLAPDQGPAVKVRPTQDGEKEKQPETKVFVGTLIKLETPNQTAQQEPVPGSLTVAPPPPAAQQQQQTTQGGKQKPAEPMTFVLGLDTVIKGTTQSQDAPKLAVGQMVRVTYKKWAMEKPGKGGDEKGGDEKGGKGKVGNKQKLDTPEPNLVDPAQGPAQGTPSQESPKQKDRQPTAQDGSKLSEVEAPAAPGDAGKVKPQQDGGKTKPEPQQDGGKVKPEPQQQGAGKVKPQPQQDGGKTKPEPQQQETAVFYAVSVEILPVQTQQGTKN